MQGLNSGVALVFSLRLIYSYRMPFESDKEPKLNISIRGKRYRPYFSAFVRNSSRNGNSRMRKASISWKWYRKIRPSVLCISAKGHLEGRLNQPEPQSDQRIWTTDIRERLRTTTRTLASGQTNKKQAAILWDYCPCLTARAAI